MVPDLTPDLSPMALVDSELPSSEREELAKRIHSFPKPEKPRAGKLDFPLIS